MDSLSEQSKPNIAKTTRGFAVPVYRLRRRWKGGKSLFQRQPNGRKLSSVQEKALYEYIDYFNAVGDYHNDTELPLQIGDHWLQRFLKRNPDYYVRRRRALDIKRSAALNKSVVQRWFEDYKRIVTEHGIYYQDIYNFDKTGF
ncbi:hypothetical protein N7536_006459 [Penicillium majusculum]|nr:hypothetical protein N7536_006459 [Penicillium majusculum]